MIKRENRIFISPLVILGLLIILSFGWTENSHKNNANLSPGIVKDIDGNIYHIITIGPQVWMVENLKVTHYRNGDPIPVVSDDEKWSNLTTGAYCDYQNASSNSAIYGKLYNWYAVNDKRNIAPSGWHIPSDAEWTTLTSITGGTSDAGNKLKEKGETHWQGLNANVTNESGFTALPGGFRDNTGTFSNIGYYCYWWSTIEKNTDYASLRTIVSNSSNVNKFEGNKVIGISVRCLKD